MSIIFSKITIIPEEEYISYKKEIMGFTPDIKDWPFLALAKHFEAAVWTYDSALLKQNQVKIFTTSDLVRWLRRKVR